MNNFNIWYKENRDLFELGRAYLGVILINIYGIFCKYKYGVAFN